MTYSTLASIVKYPYCSAQAGKKSKFGFFAEEQPDFCRIADTLGMKRLDTPDGKVRYAIVVIGINCSQQQGDFPPEIASIATSLAMDAGKPIDRSHLTAALIEHFWNMDRQLLSNKIAIMEAYSKSCITLGKEVSVHRFDSVRHGIAQQLDADGGLTVRFPDGSLETVNAGEVSVRGMYGYI